ncbi:SulP family inorganic anion transporter [Sulfurifustis variabilis]|uniref:SulP family inorganic anion transporter n=1 Tax=Sulfurifustis variabilis TaxID=1675686 RepID=UPI0018D54BEC|nr:SulP family inorganic anion transporter [Sulfurifustis variabilis]
MNLDRRLRVPVAGPWLRRLLPFVAWMPELRDGRILRTDFVAGLTVALVLIPQSMAYAQLAGLPPYYGLYAAFLPPLVAALFGSSRQLATGPVAVVSLMTAAALEPIAAAGGPGYIAYAITLSLIVGVFQFALGLLRLGVLVNFLSHPVVVGFTNAAAIIIATSQLDKIFGVRVEKAAHHYETVWATVVAAASYIHWPTFVMAVAAFTIMIVLRRVNRRLPNVLIAVGVTTVLAWATGFEKVQQAALDQFPASAVQEVVADQLRLRDEIPQFDARLAEARARLAETVARHGWNDARALAAQHAIDTLKLQRDRRVKTAAADLKELRAVRFRYVPGAEGAPGRYYLLANLPEGAHDDGNIWRIRTIGEDGSLEMNGGGNVVGAIPRGVPSLALPKFDLSVVLQLLSAAITISLIGFMEAISIAKAMATKTRQKVDANQELIGQGLSNVVGSLFQSYPTSGSFSRSAVNMDAGAVTGFSSVVTSLIVVVTLLWLTPLLYHLPQATLAAVIMMAVVGLINVRAIRHAWQAQRQDGVVAVVTFALTLAFAPHLDKGILVGVGLALILYLYRTMQPRVAILARHPDGTLRDAEVFGLKTCENISMIRFDGSLYFANTSYFEDKVQERVAVRPNLRYVIVVGDGINQIDATGEEMLAHLADRLEKAGIRMVFTGLKKQVIDAFQRTGLYRRLGPDRFFRTEEQALDQAWKELGGNHEADCPLNVVCPIELTPGARAS